MSSMHVPISKLHRDILWSIFSINAEVETPIPTWYPPPDPQLSPLTIIVRSSQVCKLWRDIILESPSIWGNCLDLDMLRQKTNKWRNEVLRRTGTALLAVRAHNPLVQEQRKFSVVKFTINLISTHWARIKVLDITLRAPDVLNDPRIESAFRRPAKHLQVFSIQGIYPPIGVGSGNLDFRGDNQIFAKDAPELSHFSISASILTSSSLFPFPSILLTGRLRHLVLDQPLTVPGHEFCAAFAHMPLLEELTINIASISVETTRAQAISLPHLKSIFIGALCLDAYPEFLGRIVAHPKCQWDVTTANVTSVDNIGPKKLANYAEEIKHIMTRHISGFFVAHNTGPSSPTFLALTFTQEQLCISAHQQMKSLQFGTYFQTIFDGDIPDVLQRSFAEAISGPFQYPESLTRFRFTPLDYETDPNVPLLAPFFLSLRTITELYTTVRGLAYFVDIAEAENCVFFEALHTIFLLDSGPHMHVLDAAERIKPFFTKRLATHPIKVLNLTESEHELFGDLESFDDLTGLKVLWQDSYSSLTAGIKQCEYICGSGDPSKLSFDE